MAVFCLDTYPVGPSPAAVGLLAWSFMTLVLAHGVRRVGLGVSIGENRRMQLTDCAGFLPLLDDDHILSAISHLSSKTSPKAVFAVRGGLQDLEV